MEWWSVFRTARRAVFGVISIISLLWSILLSVYLAREWKHAVEAQRVIVLLMICMNTVFSVLLYLMIVVVFQIWLDFARTVFLFAVHFGIAVSLTILGHTFDCSVFKSQQTCTGTYRLSLSVEWMMAVVFLLHAITLCVMSRIPQPQPEEPMIPKERLMNDIEGQFHEIDLKSAVSAVLSPDLEVHKVERVSVAPAMLMTLGSTPVRGPSQYARMATPVALSRTGTVDDLPTLPYGASSVARFVGEDSGRVSPAPSYSSTDLVILHGARTPTRRMRSLRLNRYAVDPLARNGSVNSLGTTDSSASAYSQISSATIGGFPRPPQAVVLKRSSSDVSALSQGPKSAVPTGLPPQLRPGTPSSARAFNLPRMPTGYSPSTNGPSRADTAMPDSFHSVEPSLCFMDSKEVDGAVAGEQDEKATLLARRSMGLSRQPTQKLQLPNPFSPEVKVARSPTV